MSRLSNATAVVDDDPLKTIQSAETVVTSDDAKRSDSNNEEKALNT